jgi:hypothetical protein
MTFKIFTVVEMISWPSFCGERVTSAMKMKAVCRRTFESLVPTYKRTLRHKPKDQNARYK